MGEAFESSDEKEFNGILNYLLKKSNRLIEKWLKSQLQMHKPIVTFSHKMLFYFKIQVIILNQMEAQIIGSALISKIIELF